MCDAGNQFPDSGELFGATEVIGNFLLLGEIANPDYEADDVVARIADVTERHRGGKLGSVLPAMHVLAGPKRFVELDGRDCLAPRDRR